MLNIVLFIFICRSLTCTIKCITIFYTAVLDSEPGKDYIDFTIWNIFIYMYMYIFMSETLIGVEIMVRSTNGVWSR